MSSMTIPSLAEVVGTAAANVITQIPERDMMEEREQMEVQTIFEEEMQYTAKFVQYHKVVVLMLSWADSDLNKPELDKEIQDLSNVFTEEYGFEVINRVLNSQDQPQLRVRKYLLEFVMDNPKKGFETLLIVYYAGHGWGVRKDPDTNAPSDFMLADVTSFNEEEDKVLEKSEVIEASRAVEETWIAWRGAEDILANAENADILAIFDCCDTGSLCLLRAPHKFEFLGACSQNKTTPPAGPNSFTRALIWALLKFKQQKKTKFFTTGELRKKITEAPGFPENQYPQLGSRKPTSDQIVIAPSTEKLDSEARGELEKAGVQRKPNNEFLDIQFRFDGPLQLKTVRETVKSLNKWMRKNNNKVTGIRFLEKHNRHTGRFSGAVKKLINLNRFNRPRLDKLLQGNAGLSTPATTVREASADVLTSGSRGTSPTRSARISSVIPTTSTTYTSSLTRKRSLENEQSESPRRQRDLRKRTRQ